MTDLSLLIGAAVFAAGMLTGRFWPARRKGVKAPRPVCGCGHDLAHHEPDGDGGGLACHQLVKGKITRWDVYGSSPVGWEMVQCSCRQYSGPRFIDPGYVAREITDA